MTSAIAIDPAAPRRATKTSRPASSRPRRAAVIANGATSIINFRGPLVAALVEAGVEIFALAPDFDEASRAAVQRLGATPIDITLERTGLHLIQDIRDIGRLCRTLRDLKLDFVFSYFIKPVIYGSLAAKFAGVPRRYALIAGLGHVYSDYGHAGRASRRLLRIIASGLYKLAFRTCDRVFFQNDDDIRQFVVAGIVEPGKAFLLNGTGVDLNALRATPPLLVPITFLMMCRLLREKGVLEFLAAAKQTRASYPEARFVLLGGADANPGALSEAEVARTAAASGVEWLGHVSDVKPYIEASSVYVLPSYYREGKPRSTQEAMAFGRAVITTDAPGCRDTVLPGVSGFLVPVRDSQALAAAMIRFLEEPRLIETMGRESRRLAEERFDVRAINRLMMNEFGIEQDQH